MAGNLLRESLDRRAVHFDPFDSKHYFTLNALQLGIPGYDCPMNLPDFQPIIDGLPKAVVYLTGVVSLLIPLVKNLQKLAFVLKKTLDSDPIEKSFV